MKICISRYYRRERLDLECEIITPMFLGNARQEAELRAASFKGLLRYWWRIAEGFGKNSSKLLAEEAKLFGTANDDGGKSAVIVQVHGSPVRYAAGEFPYGKGLTHKEVRNRHGNPIQVDSFLYLGYGPIQQAGKLKKEGAGAFKPAQQFSLILDAPQKFIHTIGKVIALIDHFGGIGSRNRNGWGKFQISKSNSLAIHSNNYSSFIYNWNKLFEYDYPVGLGLDDDGNPLLWKTERKQSWQDCLNELAKFYLEIRLAFPFSGKGPHPYPQDRHLLGYPAGRNHGVNRWGNKGRHASALRLIVRREMDGYHGYFLHLPYRFSERMWSDDVERQKKIWRKVHKKLDDLGLSRVSPEEVLA